MGAEPTGSARAAAAIAAVGFAGAMVANLGDAAFLARIGGRHLGTAFALSSALLIVVLGAVGAVADRFDRGRVMASLALLAAVAVSSLAALDAAAPKLAAGVLLVGGKQLTASLDLVFWVLIARQFDARQSRVLIPRMTFALGIGTAAGAFAVGPLSTAIGTSGALLIASAGFAVASLAALSLGASGRIARVAPVRAIATERDRVSLWAWLPSEFRAARASPLSARLAVVVALGGVFAPILYYLFGVASAAALSGEAELAGFLGQVRGAVQIVTLVVSAVVAPALFARLGVARLLLVAPSVAVAAAVAIAVHPVLAVVVVAQATSKLFDATLQTPAEKLTQNLLDPDVRGRVAGFIDGVAKRSGAIAGGLIASALVVMPTVLAVVTVASGLLWLVVSIRLRQRFADLAVGELSRRRSRERRPGDSGDVVNVFDARGIGRLRHGLRDPDTGTVAAELVADIGSRGKLRAARELAEAIADVGTRGGALVPPLSRAVERERATGDDTARAMVRAIEVAGVTADQSVGELAELCRLAGWIECDQRDILATAVQSADAAPAEVRALAVARLSGDEAELQDALADVTDEVAAAEHRGQLSREPTGDAARALLRSVRRIDAPVDLAAAADALVRAAPALRETGAEWLLLASQYDALAARLGALTGDAAAAARAAAMRLYAALGGEPAAQKLCAGLSDREDQVRDAALAGLREVGEVAALELLLAARVGRRRSRQAAAAALRDLRISSAAIDELVERELSDIASASLVIGRVAALGGAELTTRRLGEHIDELTGTLLALVEARTGRRTLGELSRQLLSARDRRRRARAIEALDTALPGAVGARLLPILDATLPPARAAAAASVLGIAEPSEHDALAAVIEGDDDLAKRLLIATLPAEMRRSLAKVIARAAEGEVSRADPMALLAQIASGPSQGDSAGPTLTDMPRSVDTIMALSGVDLFSDLSTRQLGELADVVTWRDIEPGEAVFRAGEPGDALYFVMDGAMTVELPAKGGAGPRTTVLASGEPFGEMALFDDSPRYATVTAAKRSQIGRIGRADFEELCDDIPAIALAICRVLSRRVRERA